MNKEPYQRMPISTAALYWKGISIRAARAKAISFSVNVAFVDIISLRLTIYIQIKDIIQKSMHELYSTHICHFPLMVCCYCNTWKFCHLRARSSSPKFFMSSKGPSPTLTRTIESGYHLDNKIKISIPLV